jgi:hypothetical protein
VNGPNQVSGDQEILAQNLLERAHFYEISCREFAVQKNPDEYIPKVSSGEIVWLLL